MSINSLDGIKPGDLYTTNGTDVWIVDHYCEYPTITMKNVRTGKTQGGAVGSPNVKDFVKLVPKEPIEEKGPTEKAEQ